LGGEEREHNNTNTKTSSIVRNYCGREHSEKKLNSLKFEFPELDETLQEQVSTAAVTNNQDTPQATAERLAVLNRASTFYLHQLHT